MKAIFLKELKLSRKGLLIWSLVILVTIGFGIVEYPMVSQNVDLIMEGMAMLPRIVVIMFGLEGIGLQTSIDYHLALFFWISLIVYFHAIITGVTVLGRDQRDRTFKFIYTKPYKRNEIIIAKVLSGIVNISILALVTWIGSIFTIYYVDGTLSSYISGELVIGTVTETIIGMFFAQILLFSIGILFAGIISTHGKALRFGFLYMIFVYALSIIIQFSRSLDFLRILSPLSYFEGLSVVNHGIDILFLIISVVVSIGFFYISIRAYKNKDLVN